MPLRLYGDGADAHNAQHFELMSMLPILCASSSTMDSRLLLTVRSCDKTTTQTRTDILTVIAWSFEALRACTLKFSMISFLLGKFLKIIFYFQVPGKLRTLEILSQVLVNIHGKIRGEGHSQKNTIGISGCELGHGLLGPIISYLMAFKGMQIS